jgi:hypothetical protein
VGEIHMIHGHVALVDDEDVEWLNQNKWHVNSAGYPRRAWRKGGKSRTMTMHRAIMKPGAGLEVDHINGNKLDNRRANLRICTRMENARNMPPKRTRKHCPFKGVKRLEGLPSPWGAFIRVNGVMLQLGWFKHPEEAALAYDLAAREHYGAFARCNCPDES